MDITIKYRYVAEGHLVDTPSSMTYASFINRDSVYIIFLIDDINILEILEVGIQNYYLNAPTKDKVVFYVGDESKLDQQSPFVIIRALYGPESNALARRNHFWVSLGTSWASSGILLTLMYG